MSSVKVTANEAGEVIVKSENNSLYGYIRVEQDREIFDEATGWLKIKKLSALIPGAVSDLKILGWKNGQSVPGKIVIKEQLLPFSKTDPDKHLKIAGDTGVICTKDGAEIYRNTFYSPNPNAVDVLIPHDNKEEIKQAQAELEAVNENKDVEL